MSLAVFVAGGPWLTFTSLRHDGEELLAPPDAVPRPYRVHAERAGITLMHPWANRLSRRCPGVPADANGLPIHGLPGRWEVAGTSARTSFPGHEPFPWPHDATVRWSIEGDALHVVTELRAPEPVPVVFGWHPYFALPGPPRAQWVLEMPRRRHLELDARGLPTGSSSDEPSERASLGSRAFDDGYEADGVWAVEAGGRRVEIVPIDGFPAVQVFAPLDADVVAVEPMAAVTNALCSGHHLGRATHARAAFSVRVSRPGG